MTLFTLYVVAVAFFNYLLVPGVAISRPPWIVGLLLIGSALFRSLRKGSVPQPGPFGLALGGFAATTIVNGVAVWLNPALSVRDYWRSEFQFLLVLGVVWAFARARLSERGVAQLFHAWVWTAGAAALFGLYQAFARILGLPLAQLAIQAKGYSGMLVKEYYGFFAISSWFAEPSWLGSYLIVPLLYLAGVIVFDVAEPIGFARRRAWLLLVAIALALFLSLSQAAYATLLLVSVALVWSLRGRLRLGRTLRFGVAIAVVVVPIAFLLRRGGADVIRAQRDRLTGLIAAVRSPAIATAITSYTIRLQDMRAGLALWESSPLLGVGINNVRYHEQAGLLTDPPSGSVDSGLLQLLVEQGLLGFLALALALAILWDRLRLAYGGGREQDEGRRFLLWFLRWGLFADVVNSAFTHPWQHPQRWIVIAAAASLVSYLEGEAATGGVRGRAR